MGKIIKLDDISFSVCSVDGDELFYICIDIKDNRPLMEDSDIIKFLGLSYDEYRNIVIQTVGEDNIIESISIGIDDILFVGEDSVEKMLKWYNETGVEYIFMNILSGDFDIQ